MKTKTTILNYSDIVETVSEIVNNDKIILSF